MMLHVLYAYLAVDDSCKPQRVHDPLPFLLLFTLFFRVWTCLLLLWALEGGWFPLPVPIFVCYTHLFVHRYVCVHACIHAFVYMLIYILVGANKVVLVELTFE